MNIYRRLEEISYDKRTVLTLGTFDGIHLGHRAIIDRLKKISEQNHLRDFVITMEPHPQVVLNRPDRGPIKLLTTIEERLILFESLGISNCFVLEFNKDIANMDGKEFVEKVMVNQIGVSKILMGYDHLFGKNRGGNEELLKNLGQIYNFEVERLDGFEKSGVIVSSTKIRKAINEKKLDEANDMLGHYYFVIGEVVHGVGRGRKIGYPTANIKIENEFKLIPPVGVYFVSSIINGNKVYGMANIGFRPTFHDDLGLVLEVYFFDLNQDLYGMRLQIEFIKYLREEKKFNNVDELLIAMKEDERICKKLISEMK
ncbi:MAG: bifunctional riboflavin kinase/FAD synthetase [Candidatus Kapabacteria bacterium]|nr:bifunctional riboflavin kinase/FAD synthetase [Candidatus Kapabacteria bacterium]